MKVLFLILLLAAPQLSFAGGGFVPHLTVTGGDVDPGETLTSSVILEHSAVANGWMLAICHDETTLALDSFDLGAAGATVNNGSPPEFFDQQSTSNGWFHGVVITLQGGEFLPAGTHELATATYTALRSGESELCPCDLPLMPVLSTFIVYGGASIAPEFTCGEVTVSDGFIRGDANADGGVDVGDAVEILNGLFGGSSAPCLEAADVNADAVVDIADPIALLAYLFAGGIPPSAPFPECGAVGSSDCAARIPCL